MFQNNIPKNILKIQDKVLKYIQNMFQRKQIMNQKQLRLMCKKNMQKKLKGMENNIKTKNMSKKVVNFKLVVEQMLVGAEKWK